MKDKTMHYWTLHKEAFLEEWDRMSNIERKIIADDVEHSSYMFKAFNTNVKMQAGAKYHSAAHPLNDKYTFQYPQ
jgi:hypothetical protein